jgi:ribosome-associated protein
MDETNDIKEKSRFILIEDSRQQAGKHKNVASYCQRVGIEIVRQKLEVGDYMFPHDSFWSYPMISVDTKESILELSKNIMSDDHKRFKAECIRSREMGIQLIVLVEEVPPFGRLDMWEIPRYRSTDRFHRYGDPMTRIHPASLRQACITMQERYGVKFRFCTRRQSPARIIKYLKGELK